MIPRHFTVTPGLTDNSRAGQLPPGLVEQLSRLLQAKAVGLREGACRFESTVLATEETTQAAASLAEAQRVDWAWIPEGQTLADFRVLAMDMDSTMINIECIDELADYCGQKASVAAITEAAMRGEIADYAESLRQRVALLAGLSVGAVDSVIEDRLRFNPGAARLVAEAKAAGLTTLLVSGGFTHFTDFVTEQLGIDRVRSNVLEVVDGCLTGRLLGPLIDGQAKRDTVLELCEALGCSGGQVIAVGDGSNDLPMMSVAGLSVAYHAKPAVRQQAMRAISYGGLDSLLLGWNEPLRTAVN
jgi:phosphoserine phosphatase